MKYNYDKHLYVLEIEHLKNNFALDFMEKEGSKTKAVDRLYRISRTVYNWIYAHTHYIKQMEYWLAFDEDLRPVIQNALEEQARYEHEMNAEFLTYQHGVNVINGMIIPLNRFRGEAQIAPQVQNILRNAGILYQGQRFLTKLRSSFNYEEMGY